MRNLGALADSTDYPSAAQLPSMFSVSVDLKPIPAISDYKRLSVPAELQEALGERHQVAAQVQVQNAMNDLRDRFIEELTRIDRQMSKVANGEKTRLYDSLVTNMQLLVDMAGSMNLTGNPKLQELVARIEQKILAKPVQAYKDDPHSAAVLAADSRALAVDAAIEDVWN